MKLFTEDNIYNDVKFPITSEIKRRFKTTEEGVSEMCEVIERNRAEGRMEGQERVNALNKILIAAKRFVDLEKAANDLDYQNKLMKELLPV